MSDGRQRRGALAAAILAASATAGAGTAFAADKAHRHPAASPSLAQLVASSRVAVETVHFAGKHGVVRVVRGLVRPASLRSPPLVPPVRRQIVSFGDGTADRVIVMRGMAADPASLQRAVEVVRFADPLTAPVRIVRGSIAAALFPVDLFGPANRGDLDRIAFAVDDTESRHGADPGMWRPQPDGPQGPMQVSAAAALDVGGGDRFDLRQNRLLGRAYLAQMFRRYGNWADALAAYNWGPAKVDGWIAGGRRSDALPPGVAFYIARVLRDALVTTAAAGP